MLEREQNERDVLEALGEYCKYKFSTGWAVGVVKSVEKKKSVAGQFALKYESETYCWNKKLNKAPEYDGGDKYWVLLGCKLKNKHC